MLSNFILVGCGAALGAWGRYIVSKLVNRLFSGNFPLATNIKLLSIIYQPPFVDDALIATQQT